MCDQDFQQYKHSDRQSLGLEETKQNALINTIYSQSSSHPSSKLSLSLLGLLFDLLFGLELSFFAAVGWEKD